MMDTFRSYAGRHKRVFVIVAAFFASGIAFAAGLQAHTWKLTAAEERCGKQYSFVNPGMACDGVSVTVEKTGFRYFEERLQAALKEIEQGEGVHTAVYFRDLHMGGVFGVNERDAFAPASLLKTPLMIALLKRAEKDPALLDAVITRRVQPGDPIGEVDAVRSLMPDQPYTVREVIRKMIEYSDNESMRLLTQYFEQISGNTLDPLFDTYVDLGLSLPRSFPDDFVTVRQYSTLFRILYNASYLNAERSQEALSILARSDFREGLVGGVPEGIQVAHKFGIRGLEDAEQLHDCGIVYYPWNPYLLCVMTRGKDAAALPPVIQKVSRMVYEEFDARARKEE
jgi:beta-lactamase class A